MTYTHGSLQTTSGSNLGVSNQSNAAQLRNLKRVRTAKLFGLLVLVGVAGTYGTVLGSDKHERPSSIATYSCANCFGPRPTDCWTATQSADPPTVNGSLNDHINTELNSYAAAYLDAHRLGCQTAARDFLDSKIEAVLDTFGDATTPIAAVLDVRQNGYYVHPFRAWLAGGMVTHLFAAARALLEAGTPVDDTKLQLIEELFASVRVPQDFGCGLGSMPDVNSCMDDYSITASGFAWIAAYESAKSRPTSSWISAAELSVTNALKPMEAQTGAGTGGGPCVVALKSPYSDPLDYVTSPAVNCGADLANVPATARVIGADHGQESPGYGVGLMTAIGSACAALYFAGSPCDWFDEDQEKVALGLLQHAQLRTPQDSSFCSFSEDCLDFETLDPVGCSEPDLSNADGGYFPKDFPVALFYSKRNISGALGSPYYQFDQYCENRTSTGASAFWGANRKAFYQILGYQIFADSPTLSSISKSCASTTGGLGVSIGGADFQEDLYLYLAGSEVTMQSVSSSSVSVTTPSRAPSAYVTGDVVLVNPGPRKAVLSSAFSWALRGDANNSGTLEAADIFRINSYLIDPTNYPLPVLCSGDANSSESIEAADMFYLNAYLLGLVPPGP